VVLRYVILHFVKDFPRNNIANKSSVYTELQGKHIVKNLHICINSLPPYITKVL